MGQKGDKSMYIGSIKADDMEGRCLIYTEQQKRMDRKVQGVYAINPSGNREDLEYHGKDLRQAVELTAIAYSGADWDLRLGKRAESILYGDKYEYYTIHGGPEPFKVRATSHTQHIWHSTHLDGLAPSAEKKIADLKAAGHRLYIVINDRDVRITN
jgi:hypothetical protein